MGRSGQKPRKGKKHPQHLAKVGTPAENERLQHAEREAVLENMGMGGASGWLRVVLYLGTMFAPVEDRDVKGQGFTHKVGDVVTIASPRLGRLSNRVVHCSDAEPWTFGTGALMHNLARRGLI